MTDLDTVTLTFVRKDERLDIKADDNPSNANGDGKVDYLSFYLVKVAIILVVGFNF